MFFVAFLLCLEGCNTAKSPNAYFEYIQDGLKVSFINLSLDATRYEWDFGDGTYSLETNPTKYYQTSGTYKVQLTAYNDKWQTFTTKSVLLSVRGGEDPIEDKVAPKITLPKDETTPVFQLGDTASALKGVTAIDAKDGDVTSNLSVLGLDYVGNTTLVYSAFDAANNVATAERPAVISAARLCGTYYVSSVDMDFPEESFSYTANVTLSSLSPTHILISNFWDLSENCIGEAYGDGTNTLVLNCLIDTRVGKATVKGRISYGPTSFEGQYTLLVADYTIEITSTGDKVHIVDTFSLKE